MKKNLVAQRKISETFLDFSSPLVDALGEGVTAQPLEEALKITCLVWNAVTMDTVKGRPEYITMLRETLHDNPLLGFIEELIARKRAAFGDDLRLIGTFSMRKVRGEWRLRVEARDSSRIR